MCRVFDPLPAGLLLLVACMAVVLGGCNDYNVYSLEMTPRGPVIKRSLSCWRVSNTTDGQGNQVVDVSKEELAAIAKIYGPATSAAGAKKHHFVKQFADELPDDIGGRGTYSFNESPMGAAAVYVERFRGDDDIERGLAGREQAIDEWVDLLLGWFQQEMDSVTDFALLKPYLNDELRRDLKNLLHYGWLAKNAAPYDEQAAKDAVVRAGQYLFERGYFTVVQLPEIARSLRQTDAAAPTFVRRFLASKMGVAADQPLPKSLDFLSDGKRVETSWNSFLFATPQYESLIVEWNAADPDTRGHRPKPSDVTDRLQGDITAGLFALDRPDKLEVRLNCPVKPWQTNGDWNGKENQVVWSRDLAREAELPTLCHAIWSTPEVVFQRKHFGKVVLNGSDLQQFVLWYAGLTNQEAAEWDRFVADLSPGERLERIVRGFRFSHEPAAEKEAKLSGAARSMILSGLSSGSN